MAMSGNRVSLYTSENCTMQAVKRKQTGEVDGGLCSLETHDQRGCSFQGSQATFGFDFNKNGGGVYALEVRKDSIRIWFFSQQTVPTELGKLVYDQGVFSKVDTTKWGDPLTDFPSTEYPIEKHFRNQSIIANIELCGEWAGQKKIFSDQDHCPGNCVQYVAEQPGSVYEEAYWEFGGWWVLQAL